MSSSSFFIFFFFNDTATTEIYTLSLHDALPISAARIGRQDSSRHRSSRWNFVYHAHADEQFASGNRRWRRQTVRLHADRKSTRLNSSHSQISYAVFCLKKKKKQHHKNSVQYNVH